MNQEMTVIDDDIVRKNSPSSETEWNSYFEGFRAGFIQGKKVGLEEAINRIEDNDK